MFQEPLYSEQFVWEGKCYVMDVYRHTQTLQRCSHMAATTLAPGDTVISDGRSVEEVLRKQQDILPLAILSRSIL